MSLVRQWLSRHSNPIFWVGGTSTCIWGVRGGAWIWISLGWAGLGQSRPRSTKVTRHRTLQARSTMAVAPARMTKR